MNAQSPVKVKVEWTDAKGRNRPLGTSYVTVAKFAEDSETWPREGWSVALTFVPGSAQARSFEAMAGFLQSDAPWRRLKSGCVFELYEGNRRTATVTVL